MFCEKMIIFAPKLKTSSYMEVIDFSKTNSVINQFMYELRDKNYQKNRLTFRHNITRIGEMMAYELSKTLDYKPKTVTTPLGTLDIPLIKDDIVR